MDKLSGRNGVGLDAQAAMTARPMVSPFVTLALSVVFPLYVYALLKSKRKKYKSASLKEKS